jgi:alpha-D-ribose 1-methylphosphonate 5-triphosphate synthase subunit PhnL
MLEVRKHVKTFVIHSWRQVHRGVPGGFLPAGPRGIPRPLGAQRLGKSSVLKCIYGNLLPASARCG